MAATKTTKAIIELAAEVKAQNAEAKNNEMKNEENRREMVSLLSDIRDGILSGGGGGGGGAEKVVESEGKKMKIPLSTILGAAVASLAFIPGLFMGFFGDKGLGGQLKKLFPKTSAKITQFFTRISTFFKNLGTKIAKPFKIIGGRVSNFGKTIGQSIDDFIKPIKTFFSNMKTKFTQNKAVKGTSKFIADLGDDFKKLGDLFKSLKGGAAGGGGPGKLATLVSKITTPFKAFFGSIGKFFTPFKSFMGTAGKLAPKFLSIGKTVGGIAGKLFLPITIIMGAFDGIKGFIDGFKSEDGNMVQKILSGLGEGTSRILQGLLGMPLDLLKKGVAWILGKFGFDNAKEALESFSFSDLIGKLMGGITGVVKSAVQFITDLFTNPKETLAKVGEAFGKVKDAVNNVLKKILKFILPKPDPNAAWYSFGNLASKAIPKSVYAFAGIDKDTGAEIPEELDPVGLNITPDDVPKPAPSTRVTSEEPMQPPPGPIKKIRAYGVEFTQGAVPNSSNSGIDLESGRIRTANFVSKDPTFTAMDAIAKRLEQMGSSGGGVSTNVSNTHVHGQKGNSAAQKLQLIEAETF